MGEPVSQELQYSGSRPGTWSIEGNLPKGLTLDGENGIITAAIGPIAITSGAPGNAEVNDIVVFTAIPGAIYEVKEWKINGASVA